MKNLITSINVRKLCVASSVGLLIAMSACNKDNDNDTPQQPGAALMAFNLAPDVPALNITLSGNSITNTPLDFPNYTGAYLNIFAGERPIEASAGGSKITSSNFTFEPNRYYSLFVAGADNVYTNIVANDNFDSLSSASGQAYIRYINAIPDSSKPLITITSNGNSLVNETAAFARVAEFVAATPGQVTISANNQGNIQTSRTISVEQNKVYTVLLTGMPAQTADSTKKVQIRYVENGTLAAAQAGQ